MSHTSLKELQKYIDKQIIPESGTHWKHYKGDVYIVGYCVMNESTEEVMVTYQPSEGKPMLSLPWARPLHEWLEIIDYNGTWMQRFSPIEGGK